MSVFCKSGIIKYKKKKLIFSIKQTKIFDPTDAVAHNSKNTGVMKHTNTVLASQEDKT